MGFTLTLYGIKQYGNNHKHENKEQVYTTRQIFVMGTNEEKTVIGI